MDSLKLIHEINPDGDIHIGLNSALNDYLPKAYFWVLNPNGNILFEFSQVYRSDCQPEYFPLEWGNKEVEDEFFLGKGGQFFELTGTTWTKSENINACPTDGANELKYDEENLRHYAIRFKGKVFQLLAAQIKVIQNPDSDRFIQRPILFKS
jgi:hypothetical protein